MVGLGFWSHERKVLFFSSMDLEHFLLNQGLDLGLRDLVEWGIEVSMPR